MYILQVNISREKANVLSLSFFSGLNPLVGGEGNRARIGSPKTSISYSTVASNGTGSINGHSLREPSIVTFKGSKRGSDFAGCNGGETSPMLSASASQQLNGSHNGSVGEGEGKKKRDSFVMDF